MKQKFAICLLFVYGFYAHTQQEPQYTQYMYNMSMVNPAYMMNEQGIVQMGSLYRSQWVGINGAPKTANLFAYVPLNDNIELSANYMNDYVGSKVNLSENIFNIDVAYKIKVKDKLNIAFGLKAGFNHVNFSAIGSNVSGDPTFGNTNKTFLNLGAGVFLFHDNYYVGVSSPNLAPTNLGINDAVAYTNAAHLFVISGYVYKVNTNLKIKPSTVLKMVGGAPLSFDMALNALYIEKFELGVSYRYQDAIAGLAGFNISQNLKLGYAYDFNTSKLRDFNTGSHELILLYKFDVLGLSKNYASPRFY